MTNTTPKNHQKAAPFAVLTSLSPLVAVASLAPMAMISAAPTVASAQDETDGTITYIADPSTPIERISVVGGRLLQQSIPGAATYIGKEELEQFEYGDINRILRQVPGVNLQEEDGYGLRPNIGIRGTGIERSERITLMEDGVLIAPAPYAAPAAYYFPTAGRMEAVEVRKGSSAIKFGPRTTGGAINLISTTIPEDMGGFMKLRGGQRGFFEGHGAAGGMGEIVGALVEGFHARSNGFKSLPSGGDTGFAITDLMGKLRLRTPDGAARYQSIEIKLGYTDQTSDETYLGLTDADFATDPFQRYAGSQKDQFNSTHYQVQATHFIELSDTFDLTTIAYWNSFERDWFKLDDLDFDDGRGRIRPGVLFGDPTNALNVAGLAILRGQADSVDDALQLRHNAREYYSLGLQTIAAKRFETGEASHALEFGLRYHEDEEDRLQNREGFAMQSGQMVHTSAGAPGSHANRVAKASAWAAFVQDDITMGKLRVIPGLRFESIDLTRLDYDKADPTRAGGATGTRNNTLSVLIPGLGVSYELNGQTTLIAGVHRGFSPPGPSSNNAQEEKSVNFEAGLRFDDGGVNAEVIGFYNDYSNLLGTCSNATGCDGGDVGDQYNGGAASVRGIEARVGYTHSLDQTLWMPIAISYTYTGAQFDNAFSDGFWGTVSVGDKLPYIPASQLNVSLGLESLNWQVALGMNYVSKTRASAGQGAIAGEDLIDERLLVDASASYQVWDGVKLFVTAENLLDKTYVAARRPYGVRPGKPQTFFLGLNVDF